MQTIIGLALLGGTITILLTFGRLIAHTLRIAAQRHIPPRTAPFAPLCDCCNTRSAIIVTLDSDYLCQRCCEDA